MSNKLIKTTDLQKKNVKATRREINSIYRDVVDRYKTEYKSCLVKYKSTSSEKNRTAHIQNNWFYANIKTEVIIIALLEVVFAFFSHYYIKLLWGCFICFMTLVLVLVINNKRLNEETARQKDIMMIRKNVWGKVIDDVLRSAKYLNSSKNPKYSQETFLRYLLIYHDLSWVHKGILNLASMLITAWIVWATKDLELANLAIFIIAVVINVLGNFAGNEVVKVCAEEYYYELLKNDMILN